MYITSLSICWYYTLHLSGLLQGILTGIRGLSNGFGPAVFGLLFFFFHVELDERVVDENSSNITDPLLEPVRFTSVSILSLREW